MKRIISFLSFLFIFAALTFAQAPAPAMGANCPMAKNGACSGDKCCKDGCDMKCCGEKGAKMCSKDGAMKCCKKGSGKKCCAGASPKSTAKPDAGSAPKGV